MTNRFQWNSFFKADWWKNNSVWWYIMLGVAACGGAYVYKVIMLDNITSGPLAGMTALWLAVTIFCCRMAALVHINKHTYDDTIEVNVEKAVLASLITMGATLFLYVMKLHPILTGVGFALTSIALAGTLKNIFVQHQLSRHR